MIFDNFFFNKNNRILKNFYKIVNNINNIEPIFAKLSDNDLKKKTLYFRNRINKGESLDSLLPEAYATVREASKRVFGMRHFDVQLLGGIALHKKYITEMSTGEGKTLTSTLPAYLNSLNQKGVHIITMNEYLAERDAKKNSLLFNFLGVSVGLNISNMSIELKKKAYSADITYATNYEYGFDYLKDNMVYSFKDKVQRLLNYAIIDEVDSILIDEAKTPLIISGIVNYDTSIFNKINKIIPKLIFKGNEDSVIYNKYGDFIINEKLKQLFLTEQGYKNIEKILIKYKFISTKKSLYSTKKVFILSYILSALKAHYLYFKDVDYIVKDNKVIIVDEHTGRMMPGRRWSDGLHQCIEAKENVLVHKENQTLASITLQNYFKLYKKLCGMTGTASTESFEFKYFYNLSTIIIPTNLPMIRKDMVDLVFLTNKEKINAIITEILYRVKKKQPVLVGTISIEQSEIISNKLKFLNIKHNVLNAKMHSKEAEIISKAGDIGSITIATNIAGRGTDIVLGGCKGFLTVGNINLNIKNKKKKSLKEKWQKKHEYVVSVGGLHVIGTERHESRRIDNQLRGRSGRQGDKGSSQFYISLDDALMRNFISKNMIKFFRGLGISYGKSIKHKLINKIIEQAQIKVEKKNFDFRKQILEYDDILNEQRSVIYNYRNGLLNFKNLNFSINFIIYDVVNSIIKNLMCKNKIKFKNEIKILKRKLKLDFNIFLSEICFLNININDLKKKIFEEILRKISLNISNIERSIGYKNMRQLEKMVMLQTLDMVWREHLINMDHLRQSVYLFSYANKDPRQEYIKESFTMFILMLDVLKYKVVSFLSKSNVSSLNINNPFKK